MTVRAGAQVVIDARVVWVKMDQEVLPEQVYYLPLDDLRRLNGQLEV